MLSERVLRSPSPLSRTSLRLLTPTRLGTTTASCLEHATGVDQGRDSWDVG